MSPQSKALPFTPCCKDMTAALTFPAGRHFFVEDGVLKLTVAKTPLQGGGEGVLENAIAYCPFCGRPTSELLAPKC